MSSVLGGWFIGNELKKKGEFSVSRNCDERMGMGRRIYVMTTRRKGPTEDDRRSRRRMTIHPSQRVVCRTILQVPCPSMPARRK